MKHSDLESLRVIQHAIDFEESRLESLQLKRLTMFERIKRWFKGEDKDKRIKEEKERQKILRDLREAHNALGAGTRLRPYSPTTMQEARDVWAHQESWERMRRDQRKKASSDSASTFTDSFFIFESTSTTDSDSSSSSAYDGGGGDFSGGGSSGSFDD